MVWSSFSIPPPFSHYSAWILPEGSHYYSYSFSSFLFLLFSVFFLFLFFFFSLLFFEHWSKLQVLALILILLLVFPRLSCITQHGYRQGYCTLTQFEHWSRLNAHLLCKKTEVILWIQAIYATSPQTLFLHILPLVRV